MHLPKLTKKLAVIAGAAGLAMGASGVAFAYLSTTGSGTGSATVGTPTPVTFTVTTTTVSGLTTANKVAFSYTNPNAYKVKLTGDAEVTAVTQTSLNGTCFTGVDTGTTLLVGTHVTTSAATSPIDTIAASTTGTATSAEEPTITLHTTSTTTQKSCTFTVTVSAS